MGLPYNPFTTPPCPEDLNDLLALLAGRMDVPAGSARLIVSSTAPEPSTDILWFQPSTNTIFAYLTGSWRAITGGTWSVGMIVMFKGSVETDLTLASAAHPARVPWALCDGGVYSGYTTPNMTGRMPRGAASGHGGLGGADSYVMLMSNLVPHQHGIPIVASGAGGGSKRVIDGVTPLTSVDTIPSQWAGGVGTTAGNPVPADPGQPPVAIPTVAKYCTTGFKVYIGF